MGWEMLLKGDELWWKIWKGYETVVKQADCKDKGSSIESSIKPGDLYMNTNSLLINEKSVKIGLKIRLCQVRFTSA